MLPFGSDDGQEPDYEERQEMERELEAAATAQQSAAEAQREQLRRRVQNPEFFDKVADEKIEGKHEWLSDDLGPLFANAHFIANRREDYEQEAKWLNQNRVERKLGQHNPGRLCKGAVRKVFYKTRGKSEVPERLAPSDRQAARLSGLAATNYHSLAVQNTGLKAVAEATTVHKQEKQEETSGFTAKTQALLS